EREPEAAVGTGRDGAREARVRIADGDLRAGHALPRERAVLRLRERGRTAKGEPQCRRQREAGRACVLPYVVVHVPPPGVFEVFLRSSAAAGRTFASNE